jgi:PKD repeat protein
MKKIFTFLLFALTVFSFTSKSQTICNAAFDFAFLSNNTVTFTPVVKGDSPFVHHYWIFGDGSPIQQSILSTHTYSAPGNYLVKHYLSRYNSNGVFVCADTLSKLVVIQQACNLQAYFSSGAVAGNPSAIVFHNLSNPLSSTDSVRWTFGDGTSSSDANPTHNYAYAGSYNVCLRVKKNSTTAGSPACVSETCKTVIVASQPCNMQAYFNWNSAAGDPLSIAFQNLSTPLLPTDSVRWTFGDGVTSLDATPTHHYANAGSYNVCLRVKKNSNTAGSAVCVSEICKTVIVAASQTCNLVANFAGTSTNANPLAFAFQNTSTPLSTTDSVRWTFGDGSSSLDFNPTHIYTNPGTYNVCLRIKKNSTQTGTAPCVREICKTMVVAAPTSCNLVAYFTCKNTTNRLTLAFQNLSTPITSTDSVRWTFGDGSSSLSIHPTHSYIHAGSYTVCLRIKKNGNTPGTVSCVREFCKVVTILPEMICDSIHAGYTFQRDPAAPNKIYFYATANVHLQDQTWTLSKLGPASPPALVLHRNNPVYVFQDTGYYRVCLRAVTVSGCVKEYCTNIRVEKVEALCDLQVLPNPTTSLVNVSVQLLQPEIIHAFIYNSMNVLVKEKQQQGVLGNNIVSINVNDLPPGSYTLRISYGTRICYARFNKL